MGKLFLCSGNTHKVDEIRAILGPGVTLVVPADLGVSVEVEEDAPDFAGNALKKARRGRELSGLPSIADDSGLCVDALGGAPGVRSARFASDHGRAKGDAANNALLLEKLQGVPDEQRGARFVCALAVVDGGGGERVFLGEFPGRIAHAPRGEHGFGYDPLLLLPDGRHLAMLPADEKNAISHRARALQAARAHILEVVG